MSNTLITTDLVSNTALAMFSINAPFIMTGARTYQSDFTQSGYKVGDTINLRRQNNFLVGDGNVATEQAIVETVEPITVAHQYNTMISYTVADLTLRIEDFSRFFIQPAVQSIISQMEGDIAKQAEFQLYNYVGSSTNVVNSFASVDIAGYEMMSLGVNIHNDAYLALSLRDAFTLKSGLLGNFTPMINEDIVRSSALGHTSYFDVYQSQMIAQHTAGAGPRLHSGDSLLVNGDVTSGNTIVLSGASTSVAGYFVPGDVISIAGVKKVLPVGNHKVMNTNMQFVVTNTADSSGGGAVTITVNPAIITSGPNQNVSNAVPTSAAVTMIGSHNVNVAYPSRGLDIVCPPLYKLDVEKQSIAIDPTTGLSLAITQQGDINSYQNKMRLDLLCGFKWHPQYAVRLASQIFTG